jgi:pimeloyl-ACP methyl ester carboxylesterase
MSSNTELRPFRIDLAQADLDDLRDRLARTRWPDSFGPDDWTRGVPTTYLRDLTDYWLQSFDWRAQEAHLNALDQFTTDIDDQPIHFVHVRSAEPNALPLIMTHGYPSTFTEFVDLVGPLTNPRAFGGAARDAFHVVLPSLVGFGFSTPVRETGWELSRMAEAWKELMRRIGYTRYAVHGSDIGAGVSDTLSQIDAEHVVGVHVATDPGAISLYLEFVGGSANAGLENLSTSDAALLERLREYGREGSGYLKIQSTRPRTFAYCLTDSPVSQLAWIIEKFKEWVNPAAGLPEDAITRDRLLANVSIYWFTRSGATAADFLYEAAHAPRNWSAPPASVPRATAVFNTNPLMRRMLDPTDSLTRWTEHSEGGHFPALEVPDLLVEDIRTFFRPLRGSQETS